MVVPGQPPIQLVGRCIDVEIGDGDLLKAELATPAFDLIDQRREIGPDGTGSVHGCLNIIKLAYTVRITHQL